MGQYLTNRQTPGIVALKQPTQNEWANLWQRNGGETLMQTNWTDMAITPSTTTTSSSSSRSGVFVDMITDANDTCCLESFTNLMMINLTAMPDHVNDTTTTMVHVYNIAVPILVF